MTTTAEQVRAKTDAIRDYESRKGMIGVFAHVADAIDLLAADHEKLQAEVVEMRRQSNVMNLMIGMAKADVDSMMGEGREAADISLCKHKKWTCEECRWSGGYPKEQPPSAKVGGGEAVWLIERGQAEGQQPTVWWTGCEWTRQAWNAMRFKTRTHAEAELNAHSGIKGVHSEWGRVTEHVFVNVPPKPAAAEPGAEAFARPSGACYVSYGKEGSFCVGLAERHDEVAVEINREFDRATAALRAERDGWLDKYEAQCAGTMSRLEEIRNLRADLVAAKAEVERLRGTKRWITIRRVGGENDSMARVAVDYEVNGATIQIGSELLNSNFSSGWNLTELERPSTPPAAAPVTTPTQKMVEQARELHICRICGKPSTTRMTYNFGREHAHTDCLPAILPAPVTGETPEEISTQLTYRLRITASSEWHTLITAAITRDRERRGEG